MSEFIETTVIPQLFSKHLMKLKHLRVLVNGKEASDHSKTLTSYSTRKQSVIKLKINVLFSQAYHSLSEKERVKLLRNEEDVKQEACSSTAKKTQVVEPSDKTVQIYTLGNQSVSRWQRYDNEELTCRGCTCNKNITSTQRTLRRLQS